MSESPDEAEETPDQVRGEFVLHLRDAHEFFLSRLVALRAMVNEVMSDPNREALAVVRDTILAEENAISKAVAKLDTRLKEHWGDNYAD